MAQLSPVSTSKLVDSNEVAQIGDQGAAVTAAVAITAYVAHASGAVAVVSNAGTDLDTTAAALATLENEVTLMQVAVNAIIERLEAHGLLADN